ncbi:hypothetical protein HDU81_010881 [Chytriomyces hyalinus]|nr:hypothetical protein HDU81_010881 [Chytriomyces hyalinus]
MPPSVGAKTSNAMLIEMITRIPVNNAFNNFINNPVNNPINNPRNNPHNNPRNNPMNNPKRDHKQIYAQEKLAALSAAATWDDKCQALNNLIFDMPKPVDPKFLVDALQYPNLAMALWLNMAGTGHSALTDDELACALESEVQTDATLDACVGNYSNSAGIDSISVIEQVLCQSVVLFYCIIKLTPSGLSSSAPRLSGHVIATKIDSKKVKLSGGCFDLDLSKRVMISFEGNIQQWTVFKSLLKEKTFLHLQADLQKLQILLKVKSYFDPTFDSCFLEKANTATQQELDDAVEEVINKAVVREEAAEVTAIVNAHSADVNDSIEEAFDLSDNGAILSSVLVSNVNEPVPASMKDVMEALCRHKPDVLDYTIEWHQIWKEALGWF